jgi:hypothetical protein
MRHWQTFLDVIKTKGINLQDQIIPPSGCIDVMDALQTMQPFLFDRLPLPLSPPFQDNITNYPFHCFSIEFTDGSPIADHLDSNREILCIISLSLTSNLWDYFCLVKDHNNIHEIMVHAGLGSLIDHFINAIPNCLMGEEHIRERVKLGIGKDKKIVTFRKVIHITKKTNKMIYTDSIKRPIDWTYRFPVRGHWRKVKTIGRDAQSKPVEGKTWVSHYVKGKDSLPLLTKPRIVSQLE